MAQARHLTIATSSPATLTAARLRVAILVAALVLWELVAASGLLFRDVVPSFLKISSCNTRNMGAAERTGRTEAEVITPLR